MRLKKILKRIVAPIILNTSHINWKTALTHILIEGGSEQKKDWLNTFNQIFPEWPKFIEINFFNNFAIRDILLPQTEIYIGTWFSEELIKKSPQLKLIQLVTSGIEFLNPSVITDNIQIATASGIASESVAEHVLMLILALDRRLDIAIRQQGIWCWRQDRILQNIKGLKGRTVGIVGLGNNGRAVGSLLLKIGMKVVGIDIRAPTIEGIEICPGGLDELLSVSDFVVLCVPLTEKTKKMIGFEQLKRMKQDAYLINIARGEVIDELALSRALKKGIIKGAALDVLSSEPPGFFHPLRGCPNLIITPHIAGNINLYLDKIQQRFVSNVRAFVNGERLDGLLQNIDT